MFQLASEFDPRTLQIVLSFGLGNWNRGRYQHQDIVRKFSGQESQSNFHSDKVYIAPSGVQKERIEPTHIFVLPFPQSPTADRVFLRRPSLDLKESACTPLFWNAFDLRDAKSCIHTHSQNAVMATLLWTGPTFTISHQVSHITHMPGKITKNLM